MDGDCFNNTLEVGTCVSESNECFTQVFPYGDEVLRGCVGKEYSNKIYAMTRNKIEKCAGETRCNSAPIEFEECYSFNYRKDKPEAISPKYSLKCPLSHRPRGCYHYETPNVVVKGCVFDLEEKDILRDAKSPVELRKCLGDKCNWRPFIPRCFTCQSNHWNRKCLSDLANIKPTMCDEMDDRCFVAVIENNVLERGCLAKASRKVQQRCQSVDGCEVCDGPMECNSREVKREQCYVAEFKGNAVIILTADQSKLCAASLSPLGCYHMELAGRVVKKGCVSDIRKELHLLTDDFLVSQCKGNNCNSQSRQVQEEPKQVQGLKCHKCDSRFSDDCMDEPAKAKTCTSLSNECYTAFYSSTRTLMRGCIGDIEARALPVVSTPFSQKCSSPAKCNDQRLVVEKCYSGEYNGNDAFVADEGNSVKCPEALVQLGCYHTYLADRQTVKKGCMSELSQADRTSFGQNSEFKTCFGDNCNVEQTCLSCSSSRMSAQCITDLDSVQSIACPKLASTCVIGVDQDGQTHRACSEMDANEATKFPMGYETCNSTECNNFEYPANRLQCYHCDNCEPSDSKKEQRVCSVYSLADQCYTFREGTVSLHYNFSWLTLDFLAFRFVF